MNTFALDIIDCKIMNSVIEIVNSKTLFTIVNSKTPK